MKRKKCSSFIQAVSSLPIIDKTDDVPQDSPLIDNIHIHQAMGEIYSICHLMLIDINISNSLRRSDVVQ